MQVRDVEVPASVPEVGQLPAPGEQDPLHMVELPQSAPLRAVVASAGQTGLTPSHCSGASQVLVDWRHSVLAPSIEQVPMLPVRLHA